MKDFLIFFFHCSSFTIGKKGLILIGIHRENTTHHTHFNHTSIKTVTSSLVSSKLIKIPVSEKEPIVRDRFTIELKNIETPISFLCSQDSPNPDFLFF